MRVYALVDNEKRINITERQQKKKSHFDNDTTTTVDDEDGIISMKLKSKKNITLVKSTNEI